MKKLLAIMLTLITMFGMFATVNADEGMSLRTHEVLYKRDLNGQLGYGDVVHATMIFEVSEIHNKDGYVIDTDRTYIYPGDSVRADVKMTYGEFVTGYSETEEYLSQWASDVEANWPVTIQVTIFVEEVK